MNTRNPVLLASLACSNAIVHRNVVSGANEIPAVMFARTAKGNALVRAGIQFRLPKTA